MSTRAANAWTGMATASPSSAQTAGTVTAHHECTAPKAAVTPRDTDVVTTTRNSMNSSPPLTRSTTRSGVATIAWYVRIQRNLLSTGQADSPKATFIAVDAIIPGTMKSR